MDHANDIQRLVDLILAGNPSHTPFLQESLATIDDTSRQELGNYLAYWRHHGVSLPYMAECYNTIVQDIFVEQIYFMRHKRYRHSSYADVAAAVYDNPEYMEKYMYGLSLTLFLWSMHRRLKRFFEETLPRDVSGDYLEIGPGHGWYLMTALTKTAYSRFIGMDVSAKSIEICANILESGYFGQFTDFVLRCADFVTADFEGHVFDAVVMGEVLEHVEAPDVFLRRVRELTHAQSYIFISTCMNAPAIDHISLFSSVEHLESLINAAGLRITKECLLPYPGLTAEETTAKRMPMNIGVVLAHQ